MPAFNVSRDHSGDAWFRLGRLDVTSTLLVVLLGAVGLVASAFVPALIAAGQFDPAAVLRGQVWRAVTWPFVDGISLWSVLSLVLLWYFGTDLERQTGRAGMIRLLLGLWGTLTVVALVVGLILGASPLRGLDPIQFLVLLLWIVENPRRPFFFGIPAWALGALLVVLQVLVHIAARDGAGLVSLLVSFGGAALVARRVGLLSDLSWLPGRGGGRRTARAPAVVVPRAQQRTAQRQASDAERLDALLEKISAHGLHSLSANERKELERLRQRRRAR